MAAPSTSIRSLNKRIGVSGSVRADPLSWPRPARISSKASEREQYPSFESEGASPTRRDVVRGLVFCFSNRGTETYCHDDSYSSSKRPRPIRRIFSAANFGICCGLRVSEQTRLMKLHNRSRGLRGLLDSWLHSQ